jgi:hypothetical protein
MPHAAVFEGALRGALDETKARGVVQKAKKRYGDLYANRERYSNRALREHLEENILPGVALYQTLLEDEDTRERAAQLVEGAFRALASSSRQVMGRLGRLPVFYWLLRIMVKGIMRVKFPEEGWEIEWVEIGGSEVSFNIRRCFYLDVLEGYGVPELTAQYCLMDDVIYEGVSPYVKWAREKTLGRGDACCDFRFERVGRQR